MSQRFTLSANAEARSEAKKSRFIAIAGHVHSGIAAKQFLTAGRPRIVLDEEVR